MVGEKKVVIGGKGEGGENKKDKKGEGFKGGEKKEEMVLKEKIEVGKKEGR